MSIGKPSPCSAVLNQPTMQLIDVIGILFIPHTHTHTPVGLLVVKKNFFFEVAS